MPYAYGYGRVSTRWRGQDDSNSLEAQQEVLPKVAAEKFPGHNYHGTYWDSEISSVLPFANRKAGRTVANALQKGDILLVTKGDRIFRSLHDYECAARLYKARGVTLYIVDSGSYVGVHQQSLATLDPRTVAKLKHQLSSERTRCAFSYLHGEGIFPHRVPLGYRRNADRRLYVDVAFRALIQRLHEIRALNGFSYRDTCYYARALGPYPRTGKEWSPRHIEHAFVALRRDWPCCAGWVPTEDRSFAPAANCAAGSPGRR